jgi:hypothetical protein
LPDEIGNDPTIESAINQLNGAQITAVLAVLDRLRSGDIDQNSAKDLMVSVGMTEESASSIASTIGSMPKQDLPGAQDALEAEDRIIIAFDNGGYIPTQAMARNAKRALEVRESKPPSQRGMTAVGLARARDISNRRELPLETVKRMKAYFDRHAVDKEGETWNEQGKGWQAWHGWGGDEARTWAEAIVKREEAKTDASLRSDSVQMAEREVVQWLQRPTRAVPQDIIADDAVRTAFAGYTEAVDGYRLNLHGRLEEELKNAKRN